jgi:hypothetical protein
MVSAVPMNPTHRAARPVHARRTKAAGALDAGAVGKTQRNASRPGSTAPPTTARAFSCRCGRPLFFGNSECLSCHTQLGYDPLRQRLLTLEIAGPGTEDQDGDGPGSGPALWREAGASSTLSYLRCSHLDTAVACNWLVSTADAYAGDPVLCRCCRLTRVVPDLTLDNGARWWNRIESAKRLLVSSLLGLQLPVRSKINEDPDRGLVFDLLRAPPGGPPVITGHVDGVITIDIEEADDAVREARRTALDEPYRTLLGHLRHETGHYYWQRLVQDSAWLAPWRQLFGDERQDYAAALKKHHECGVPADWGLRFVSGYASSHPWEDWAETWAHYLHMVDTLGTARSFGLDGERLQLSYERFAISALDDAPGGSDAGGAGAQEFLDLVHSWMELTGVLNELSRSMGIADYYPFVLSVPALRKLYMVHRVISKGQP